MLDDTNWCYACDCHFEGTGIFCSPECKDSAAYIDDEPVIYHKIDDAFSRWTGSDIRSWSAKTPPFSPPDAPTPIPVSQSPRRPKLMSFRHAPPALCVTAPRPALPTPTSPISATNSAIPSSPSIQSLRNNSPLSATESSLATPPSTLLAALAIQVRSWVTPSSLPHPHPSQLPLLSKCHHDQPETASRLSSAILLAKPRPRPVPT